MVFERMSNGICNFEIYKAVMSELLPKLESKGISKEQLRTWKEDTPMPTLSHQELAKIKVIAENELSKQLSYLEMDLSAIGTVSALAPSLGLFGTVWGVLLSFMSMADGSGAAIITNVAPGIGGALLTTVAGLVVSIPTTYVYNRLCTKLRLYTLQAENFVDQLISDINLYHSPKVNTIQNIQLSVSPQQQFTSSDDYEVGGRYNA
jgi:biopolymer transport protein TolQ